MLKISNVSHYKWDEVHNYPKGNVVGVHSFTQSHNDFVITSDNGGPVQDWKTKVSLGDYAGSSLFWDGTTMSAEPYYVTESFPAKIPASPALETVHSMCRGIPYNSVGAIGNPGAPSTSIANTSALTSLTKRLSSELTSFQGGVFVGEIKETIHLIRHPLDGLRRGLSKHLDLVAKRGKRIRKLSNMKSMIAETWLETSFGVKPLLADIDDAAKVLADFVTDPKSREFKTLTAKGSHQTARDAELLNCAGVLYSAFINAHALRTRSSTVKYLTCIGVSPSVRPFALQKIGVNFANFVPTLWELIPYSFVVDYFTNVGDIINGLANLTANVLWTIKWTIVEDVFEVNNFYLTPTANEPFVGTRFFKSGKIRVAGRNILREKYSGSLIPDFRWEIPGESSLKWANLTALGVQLASTRRIVSTPERVRLTLLRKGTF